VLISSLIILPFLGIIIILSIISYDLNDDNRLIKLTTLFITIIELILSLIIWVLFDNSSKYFQFVQEKYIIGHYDFYMGVDGLSIYFILLTTLIIPISVISNWKSIEKKII
jgi:NADH-ubiquinone oxidoreductase chain 4